MTALVAEAPDWLVVGSFSVSVVIALTVMARAIYLARGYGEIMQSAEASVDWYCAVDRVRGRGHVSLDTHVSTCPDAQITWLCVGGVQGNDVHGLYAHWANDCPASARYRPAPRNFVYTVLRPVEKVLTWLVDVVVELSTRDRRRGRHRERGGQRRHDRRTRRTT